LLGFRPRLSAPLASRWSRRTWWPAALAAVAARAARGGAALLLMLAVLPGGAVFLWLGAVLVGLLFYAFLRLSLPATCT